MPYSALTIANRFLDLAERDGRTLTNMQLQKLVYIAHGWNLGIVGRPLLINAVEAWQWGPVIPRLYHALSRYGAGVVLSRIAVKGATVDSESPESNLIETVWKSYGRMPGLKLSAITHAPDTPWSKTIKASGLRSVIKNELIAEHYRSLYDERVLRRQQANQAQAPQ
jgi:uncharacterized phage-associated protein